MSDQQAEDGEGQAGGLQLPSRPEKHVFKAPAPRQSLLGDFRWSFRALRALRVRGNASTLPWQTPPLPAGVASRLPLLTSPRARCRR